MSTSTAGPVACEPRAAFVLAGGAALGAMQAGMVHALYERGIAPDLLIGTSAGALNAAFLASRPATVATAQELAALWRGLRRSDILPLRPATLISGLAGRRDHLIPDQALRRLAARRDQRLSELDERLRLPADFEADLQCLGFERGGHRQHDVGKFGCRGHEQVGLDEEIQAAQGLAWFDEASLELLRLPARPLGAAPTGR